MGRGKKYENDEAAKTAQKEQIKNSNKKYQDQRKEFRNNVSVEQASLIKLLNKHIIKDTEFITGALQIVNELIEDEIITKVRAETPTEVHAETPSDTPSEAKTESDTDSKNNVTDDDIITEEEKKILESVKEKEEEPKAEPKPKKKYTRKPKVDGEEKPKRKYTRKPKVEVPVIGASKVEEIL
jgi:hypothetical protein